MEQMYICKNGLVYTKDLRSVLGVDTASNEFRGRVPFGAHFIEDEVFAECPYQNISLPDSMESLGSGLFENSVSLKSVKLPSDIKELSPYLFSNCTALEKVTMPKEVFTFPEGVFQNCKTLTEIPFRTGLKVLGENAIAGCTGIRALVLPVTLEKIESGAAANCSNLISLVLPATVKEIADDAFEGCTALRNIRIDETNKKFYVNPEDGCLYEKCPSGDRLKIRINKVVNQQVAFFDPTLALSTSAEVLEDEDLFMADDYFEEDDDDFSAEITAAEVSYCTDETEADEEAEDAFVEVGASDIEKEQIMNEENETTVDQDVINQIMADHDEGSDSDLSAKLSGIMEEEDTIEASEPDEEVSIDELDRLFASNNTLKTPEEVEAANAAKEEEIDSKTKILMDTVGFSKLIKCEPAGAVPDLSELYVVAEKTVTDADGNPCFTKKLEECCKRFAKIQDFKRIILLADLPADNDEFMQFYHFYMSQKNVILACEAPCPSKLSPYAKMICDQSRISLEKEELMEQRKNITVKNNSMIKLVIQDKYN